MPESAESIARDYIATIPCVSEGEDGYEIPTMPSGRLVEAFMDVLAHPYEAPETTSHGDEFVDDHDVEDWYEVSDRWSTHEGGVVDLACRILGSYAAGYYAYDLRKNRREPHGWGIHLVELPVEVSDQQFQIDMQGEFRSILDRLFDRLHLNHVVAKEFPYQESRIWIRPGFGSLWVSPNPFPPDRAVLRSAKVWGSEDFYVHVAGQRFARNGHGLPPHRTLIAPPYSSAWSTMRRFLWANKSAKVGGFNFGGLTDPPGDYAFPLDWREANRDGLFGTQLTGASLGLDHIANDAATQVKTAISFLRSLIPSKYDVTASVDIVAEYIEDELNIPHDEMKELLDPTIEALKSIRDNLNDAGAADLSASEAAWSLFTALNEADRLLQALDAEGTVSDALAAVGTSWAEQTGGLYPGMVTATTGLTNDELDGFLDGLAIDVDSNFEYTDEHIVRLDDDIDKDFAGFEGGGPGTAMAWEDSPYSSWSYSVDTQFVGPTGLGAMFASSVWEAWLAAIGPSLDAARVFDTAGRIARQLVNLDDLFASMVGQEGGTGDIAASIATAMEGVIVPLVAPTIRANPAYTLLFDKDGDGYASNEEVRVGLTDIGFLPLGFTTGEVVGYLVRQLLTDLYIEYFVAHHGADRECLYKVFCWMDTKDKRDHIDDALGTLVGVPLADALQTYVQDTWGGLLMTTGLEGMFGASETRVQIRQCMTMTGAGRADYGALGSIVTQFLACNFKTGDYGFDENLILDKPLLQTWIEDAREACLGDLVETPDWYREPLDAPLPKWNEVVPPDLDVPTVADIDLLAFPEYLEYIELAPWNRIVPEPIPVGPAWEPYDLAWAGTPARSPGVGRVYGLDIGALVATASRQRRTDLYTYQTRDRLFRVRV